MLVSVNKREVDVGVRENTQKKAACRVKMCMFDPVRVCGVWFWFETLNERLRLHVSDEMRKHHFLFDGCVYV